MLNDSHFMKKRMLLFPVFAYVNTPRFGNTASEVMMMKYQDLNALLSGAPEAKQYFDTLPDYVRDQISTRPWGVNSFESLKDYAENLLRGDD